MIPAAKIPAPPISPASANPARWRSRGSLFFAAAPVFESALPAPTDNSRNSVRLGRAGRSKNSSA